jgi:hypothetical protein
MRLGLGLRIQDAGGTASLCTCIAALSSAAARQSDLLDSRLGFIKQHEAIRDVAAKQERARRGVVLRLVVSILSCTPTAKFKCVLV